MTASAPSPETIGFIGLGHMGHGMAKNLVEKGYPLAVLGHRNRKPIEDLVLRGAVEVGNARELAKRSSIVFLCVTGSPEVERIARGPDGLKEGLKPGSIVVDCSTSDPNSTLALAKEFAEVGVEYVDAPLSRTPKEAWEGTLDTMVGASEAIFERLEPVLATWAGRIVHIGATGDGHRMKLLNNFISMGYAALYAEALALSEKVGITPEKFDSVIRGGRMDCGFYQTFMRTRPGSPTQWAPRPRTPSRSPPPPAGPKNTCRCWQLMSSAPTASTARAGASSPLSAERQSINREESGA
jgi:3-hydroxyisobutyrate dehydrogenase-like beta-hydroxyacid dehydrogenase